jgi:hypothetical protein
LHRHTRTALALLILTVTTALTTGAHAQGAPFRWPTASPDAVGLNAAVFDSIDAEIRAGRYGNVNRMVVIRHGTLVVDKSYPRDYDQLFGDSARSTTTLNNSHDPTGPFNYFNSW